MRHAPVCNNLLRLHDDGALCLNHTSLLRNFQESRRNLFQVAKLLKTPPVLSATTVQPPGIQACQELALQAIRRRPLGTPRLIAGCPIHRAASCAMGGLNSAEEPGPERAFFARTGGNAGVKPQPGSPAGVLCLLGWEGVTTKLLPRCHPYPPPPPRESSRRPRRTAGSQTLSTPKSQKKSPPPPSTLAM
jgi:hypothetical protein